MSAVDLTTISISSLSLLVSLFVAWLTLLRAGTIRMTQPTSIFFGPDGPTGDGNPKIVVRTLLYSSAHQGRIIESMYVKLRRGESIQTFNIWVFGEDNLNRGSGLYVGRSGVTYSHHFLLPNDGTTFEFLAGDYDLLVYATIVGSATPVLLRKLNVSLNDANAAIMKKGNSGTYFDWGSDSNNYHPNVHNLLERFSKKHVIEDLFSAMRDADLENQRAKK